MFLNKRLLRPLCSQITNFGGTLVIDKVSCTTECSTVAVSMSTLLHTLTYESLFWSLQICWFPLKTIVIPFLKELGHIKYLTWGGTFTNFSLIWFLFSFQFNKSYIKIFPLGWSWLVGISEPVIGASVHGLLGKDHIINSAQAVI